MSIVVTGVGSVNAYGAGLDGLGAALAASCPRLLDVDTSGGYHLPKGARRAARVGALDLSRWVAAGAARRMSLSSKFALAAARQAVEDAALPESTARRGVYMATAFGTVKFAEDLIRQILVDGPASASPFLFAETVANAPAAQVAIGCGARGPNVTVTQREAGVLLAVAHAVTDLELGRVDVALAGAVDEAGVLVHAMLDRFRALARPGASGDEVARPFDRARAGFVMGEGSTVLVLEREQDAGARAARLLARVRAVGAAFDGSAPSFGWGDDAGALRAGVTRMLVRAAIERESVDLVVSGANGSVRGDRLEARVLRTLFSDVALPPVLAPKGITGEYGGAFLGAALLALADLPFGPTPGFDAPDPECGIVPHDGSQLPRAHRVLVSSLAAGGSAAWLVLDRA